MGTEKYHIRPDCARSGATAQQRAEADPRYFRACSLPDVAGRPTRCEVRLALDEVLDVRLHLRVVDESVVVEQPRSAVTALREHRKRQAAEKLAAGHLWQRTGLIFTSEIGTALELRNVLRRFELLAERAGLSGVHLHTLRHSAASFLLAAGTHTTVVQEHLGHSSYAITADIYSHVAPVQQREAADRLDQALHW